MEYATTRDSEKRYSPHQVLRQDRGGDGGLFLPVTPPELNLKELGQIPFTARIARVLNLLFDGGLSQWDVDFCVGRHPVKAVPLPQKMVLLECWHNRQGSLKHMVSTLAARLRQDGEPVATEFVELAVRIAILAAVFAENLPEEPVDVAVVSGELYAATAACYGKNWGLPIGNIILCCNENGGLWELFHRGQLRTDALSVPTATPGADVCLPMELERLLHAWGGTREVDRYLEAVRRGAVYEMEELPQWDFSVSVVGRQRMMDALRSVAAIGTLLSPYDGLCYGGLLDHRARFREIRPALLLSERAPALDAEMVTAALGRWPEELDTWEERG